MLDDFTNQLTQLQPYLPYLIVVLAGIYGAKKLGIPNQVEKLVSTLKDLVEIQSNKIQELENIHEIDNDKIASLEQRVNDLEQLVIHQGKLIEALIKKLQAPVKIVNINDPEWANLLKESEDIETFKRGILEAKEDFE